MVEFLYLLRVFTL